MYQTSNKVLLIGVGELRESPEQKQIHADFDPAGKDAWLVDDIRQHGILLPLLVDAHKQVRDGHRRLAAARRQRA